MKLKSLLCQIGFSLLLLACTQEPNIQGAWFFDYEQTKQPEFPNARYDSARDLIADIDPRYGAINVEGNTVVLGGAVCKIQQINDPVGLRCEERGQVTTLGIFYEHERLIVKSPDLHEPTLIFSRSKQDAAKLYGIDLSEKPFSEDTKSADLLSIPVVDKGVNSLQGFARTVSFNAFYDTASVKTEGRFTLVAMVLNYLEPQIQSSGADPALSSIQWLTFDCPASNYRIDRFQMFSEPNGLGHSVSEPETSGLHIEFKPVPENSINKALYMRVCTK